MDGSTSCFKAFPVLPLSLDKKEGLSILSLRAEEDPQPSNAAASFMRACSAALCAIKHAKPLPPSLGSNQACNTVSNLSTADRPLRHPDRSLPAHMTAQLCGLTGGWLLAGLYAILVSCECFVSITERDELA